MIKLRQINHSTAIVARDVKDDSPHVKKEYSLADIWVNPRAVLYLQADEVLAEENKRTPLIEGLDREHEFTTLFVSESGFTRQLTVIGEPATINSEIEGFASRGR